MKPCDLVSDISDNTLLIVLKVQPWDDLHYLKCFNNRFGFFWYTKVEAENYLRLESAKC